MSEDLSSPPDYERGQLSIITVWSRESYGMNSRVTTLGNFVDHAGTHRYYITPAASGEEETLR
jgi:hypothetical protein